ncbi:MAG: peptidoglycan-binding domain-containing protein [Candidatus Nealsonbacteria bacterium]
MKNLSFILIISIIVFLPVFVKAEQILGDSVSFYIESSYDSLEREQIQATLREIAQTAYWYVDNDWWDGLGEKEQLEMNNAITALSQEFTTNIYPVLTQNFGSEWKPGIDNDSRITILIHPMKEQSGGYFNSADEFLKSQISTSNEKEMIYFNALYLNNNLAKSFIAHEFQHLISFNQKEKTYGVSEEIWLNEARSEYAPTLLGYNESFEGSNLQRRIQNFLNKPYDSLTEWKNLPYDYGVANLFIHYLTDHYGVKILIDSLKSSETGINSLNSALFRTGFKENFSQIFTDWTIAVLVNDCSLSAKYCYLNDNLKNLKLNPLINYLPSIGKSVLSVSNITNDWAGNWHKFIGGNHGDLKVEFITSPLTKFKVPYLVQNDQGDLSITFLELDYKGEAIIYVSGFGSKNVSLTIIPSAQNKTSNFSESETPLSFFWSASTIEEEDQQNQEQELINKLLAQIEDLQKQIAGLQAQLDAALGTGITCKKFDQNLYYGMMNNNQVECLQEFLKSQEADIYPEGLVTGNFLSLTKQAVIRFQERYATEILIPIGLEKGTGFVGPMTRAKINQ